MHTLKTKRGKEGKKLIITILEEDWDCLVECIDKLQSICIGLNHDAKSELGKTLAILATDMEIILNNENIYMQELKCDLE